MWFWAKCTVYQSWINNSLISCTSVKTVMVRNIQFSTKKNIEFLTVLDSYRDVFQSSVFTRLLPRCRSWKRPNNRFTAGCQLFQELLWAARGSVTSDRGTKGEWGLVCFEKCDRRISPGEFFLLFCLRIKLVPFTGQLSQFYISVLVRLR